MENSLNTMIKYVIAYDRKIKRKVVHVVIKGQAISTMSGEKFPFNG